MDTQKLSTRTRDAVLVDEVRTNPVDLYQQRVRRRNFLILLVAVVVAIVVAIASD
jgi:hypothetical protein